ncbi:MAG: hypothetical protein ACREPV_13235 [Lysobacter sp.]
MAAIPIVLFAAALGLAISDYAAGAWVSFGVGALSLLWELRATLDEVFGSTPALIEQDERFQQELIAKLHPSGEEVRNGFEILGMPQRINESVVRSSRVDAWFRGHDVHDQVDDGKRIAVEESLREHAEPLEKMLRCRSRESYRSDPPRVFLNESKLGLSSGIALDRPIVGVHRVGYYHSVLTNEASARCLVSDGGEQAIVFSGSELFPLTRIDDRWQLRTLADSCMADHVGVSTLVVTRDRKLAVWKQAGTAQHSRKLLAPTGSGSCDWKDRESADLKETLVRAMEREFVEESFGGQSPVFDKQTRPLGYFRWVRRGGKPEFVGVTWADLDAAKLKPNVTEVNRNRHETQAYDVPDMASLCARLEILVGKEDVSVPLWINALALLEAISEDRAGWAKFLRLE